MNDKQLSQSALSTIMMVAFAVPGGGGAPLGIVAAIGSFFVGLLFPDTKSAPPPPPPVTAADLKAALDALKADIIDAGWLKEVDDITNNLPGLNLGLQDVWIGMKARKLDPHKFVMLDENGDDDPKFVTDTDQYFDLERAEAAGGMLTLLRAYRNTLTLSSLNDPSLTPSQLLQKKTQHTGVYCLVCSLTIAYLKAALAWSWGVQLLKSWQYAQYHKALSDYNDQVAKNKNYAKTHKAPVATDYPGVNTNPNYHPPTWNEWVVALKPFCAATMMIREVQAILNECISIPADGETPVQDGFFTTMQKNWDDFDKQMSGFDVPIDDGQDISTDQMATAIDQGMQRAVVRTKLLIQYAFDGITDDDITSFGRAVDAWRAAGASANFTVYTVLAGETLSSIATAKYGDATLSEQIAGANRDTIPESTTTTSPLPSGCVLKIYARDALPFVQPPPAKGVPA